MSTSNTSPTQTADRPAADKTTILGSLTFLGKLILFFCTFGFAFQGVLGGSSERPSKLG